MQKADLKLFSSIDAWMPLYLILYCDILSYVLSSGKYELLPLTWQYFVFMQTTRLHCIFMVYSTHYHNT
jgi:hypothetical protein